MIKNRINDKVYIGITRMDVEKRWMYHKSSLRHNHHCNKKLQRAFNKYGEDNFKYSVLYYYDKISDESLADLEINTISEYNAIEQGYNIQAGGKPMNDIARINMSNSHKRLKYPNHRRLNDQDALFVIVITHKVENMIRPLSRVYNVERIVIKSIRDNTGYLDVVERYNAMTEEEKLSIFKQAVDYYKKEYDLNVLEEKFNPRRMLLNEDAVNVHILYHFGYGSASKIGKIYGVKKDCILAILKGKTYVKCKEIFMSLSEEEINARYNKIISNTTT